MLVTCLILSYFIHPYWIGAVGSLVATLAERFTPTTHFWDDNASIPLVSALVMTILSLGE
jgi:dolichol kinase